MITSRGPIGTCIGRLISAGFPMPDIAVGRYDKNERLLYLKVKVVVYAYFIHAQYCFGI
jgi:hypothetical protein